MESALGAAVVLAVSAVFSKGGAVTSGTGAVAGCGDGDDGGGGGGGGGGGRYRKA